MPVVEELLRYEPPVQYLPNRFALEDIGLGDTTIPKGARINLLLAAASRDPDRFDHPDRFDPDRADNEHLGFGSGVHYCFGAPLARLEAALSLTTLARRLVRPRLVSAPVGTAPRRRTGPARCCAVRCTCPWSTTTCVINKEGGLMHVQLMKAACA